MKWNRRSGWILMMSAGCALLTTAAQAQQAQPLGGGQPAAQGEAAQPPAGQVVATVDGEPITQQEVQTTLQPQLQGQQVTEAQMQEMQQQVVNSLIESRLVEQYLRDNGPDVDAQEVQQTMGQLEQQLAAQQASMEDFLASRGYTPDMLRRRIEGSIAWQKLQQQEAANEPQLQQYFEQNREQFQEPEFDQAKDQVLSAYLGDVYRGIVAETKEKAEVRIVDPAGAPGKQPAAPQP